MSSNATSAVVSQETLETLPQLAHKIRNAHQVMREAARNALRAALDAGDALNAAKPQVPEGEWRAWLRANCSLSVRTVQLYQQLASHRAQIEAELERAADLSLRAARRLIMKSKRREGDTESKPVAFRTLAEAWAAASEQERRDHLDRVGRAGLSEIMSDELKAEFVDAVVGLEISGASALSSLAVGLTKLLRLALSTEHQGEKLAALTRLEQRLQSNRRDLHEVAVALVSAKQRRAA